MVLTESRWKFRFFSRVFILCICCFLMIACGRTRDPSEEGNGSLSDGGSIVRKDSGSTSPDNGHLKDTSGGVDRKTVVPDQNVKPEPRPEPRPEPKPKPEKCANVITCAQQKCGRPPKLACSDGCAKEIGGAGLQRWQSLRSCIVQNCGNACKPNDVVCSEACTANYCAQQWVQCASDQSSGSKMCAEVLSCGKKCAESDKACFVRCVASGTSAAQTAYASALSCVGKAKMGQLTPQQKVTCGETLANCECPQFKPGTGTGICQSYTACLALCAPGNVCCVRRCGAATSQAAMQAGNRLLQCVVTKCPHCKSGDKSCFEQCTLLECSPLAQACNCPNAPKPGSGSKKCSSANGCIQNCNSADKCCYFKCVGNLRASSYSKFMTLLRCLPKCGCKSGSSSCIQRCAGFGGKCSRQASQCISG